jgi:hypothetical protein
LRIFRGFATVVVACAAAVSCGRTGTSVPTAIPSPSPTPAPRARYLVAFDATWHESTHAVPPNPHFSGLIGGTHRDAVRFWEEGRLASEGIKRMAEAGAQSPLDQEVIAAVAAGTAEHLLTGDGLRGSPGTVQLEFEVSREHPLVTLVTMVAPSPDWFVGVSALSLFEDGDWVPEKEAALIPWDAGTDSGATFLSPDRPTNPRQPIARITTPPLASSGVAAPLGRFTFRRVS